MPKHFTTEHQRNARLARKRKMYEAKRHDTTLCTRPELMLRLAIDKLGWTVVQYEYELDGEWYDAAVWYDGELMLVDLIDKFAQRKADHAAKLEVGLLQIKHGSTDDMIGQIHMRLMSK